MRALFSEPESLDLTDESDDDCSSIVGGLLDLLDRDLLKLLLILFRPPPAPLVLDFSFIADASLLTIALSTLSTLLFIQICIQIYINEHKTQSLFQSSLNIIKNKTKQNKKYRYIYIYIYIEN